MTLNDRTLYQELLQVIAESEERRLTSETVDILHGHPEFGGKWEKEEVKI